MITRARASGNFLKSGVRGARGESGARGDESIPLPLGVWNARVHFSLIPDLDSIKNENFSEVSFSVSPRVQNPSNCSTSSVNAPRRRRK